MYKVIGTDGKEYGPVTAEGLREWIAQGRANARTKVAAEGTPEWRPLGDLSEFYPALGTASPPGAIPGPISPPPVMPRTNPLASTSLVLGIASSTVCLCCCYGLPFNVAGLICGLLALSQIQQAPDTQQGKGMAVAGIVLSVLSFLLGAALLIIALTVNSSDWLRRIQHL